MILWNFLLVTLFVAITHAFKIHRNLHRLDRLSHVMSRLHAGEAQINEESLNEIAVVGFMSRVENIAEESVFRNIHETKMAKKLRCVTDDERFARRRLVNPKTVYSGLADDIRFVEASLADLVAIESASKGADGFLAFNIPMMHLSDYIMMVQRLGVKRAVLAVNVVGHETDNGITDSTITFEKSAAPVDVDSAEFPRTNITVIKYGHYEHNQEESQWPFRIVTATSSSAIPTRDTLSSLLPPSPTNVAVSAVKNFPPLASGDLLRIITECIDLPKTFQRVYGVGPGNALDQETLVWMKSKGIPVRDRIAVLLSDFQETSEKRLHEMNNEYKMNQKSSVTINASP